MHIMYLENSVVATVASRVVKKVRKNFCINAYVISSTMDIGLLAVILSFKPVAGACLAT